MVSGRIDVPESVVRQRLRKTPDLISEAFFVSVGRMTGRANASLNKGGVEALLKCLIATAFRTYGTDLDRFCRCGQGYKGAGNNSSRRTKKRSSRHPTSRVWGLDLIVLQH
jgi:hypothetical protein